MQIDKEVRSYNKNDCVVFKKTTEEFGGLSNMASGYPVVVNGTHIRTSEALYQAMRFPDFPDIQLEIIAQKSPMTAKMISKKYREKTRKDWDKVRIPIMKWCLRVKLTQNIDIFGKLLISTDNKSIVEESNKDEFWGAKPSNNNILKGINTLGRLLMELRQLHKDYLFNIVNPLTVHNFRLYNDFIEDVKADDKIKYEMQDGLFK